LIKGFSMMIRDFEVLAWVFLPYFDTVNVVILLKPSRSYYYNIDQLPTLEAIV